MAKEMNELIGGKMRGQPFADTLLNYLDNNTPNSNLS